MVRISLTFAAAVASIVSSVAAHQNLHEFFVNGVSVGYEACIRRPPSNNPVTDVTSTDIRCNVNGLSASGTNPAPGVCNVNAGDQVTVRWDVSTHPSPIQHFLYGPVANASTADGSGTKWAKIDVTNLVDGQFANIPMESNGGLYTFTLPKNLASGDYLLRSEMLALHAAQTVGGAQFYIGCVQIHVTGPGGDCNPKFALPGVYTATEHEIYIPDLYNGFNSLTYTAPGPIGTCTATGGTQPTSTIKSTSTVKPTSTSTKTTSTTKPASSSSTKASSTTVKPTGTSCTVAKYGQCGGSGYTGCTTCVSSTCTYSNEFYSQCL